MEDKMTKLTDTQLIALTAAAGRHDGSILPLPDSIRGGAVNKVVDALIARGLAERIEDERIAVDDLIRITRAGLVAINVDPDDGIQAANDAHDDEDGAITAPEPEVATTGVDGATQAATVTDEPTGKPKRAPRRKREGTKQAAMIDMLRRKQGATIAQIAEATGWRNHTIRGAISGALKKKLGLDVTSEKTDDGLRTYRIVDAA
jgi:hypothetical protein